MKRSLEAKAVPSVKVPIELGVIKDIPLDYIEEECTDNNTSQDIDNSNLTNENQPGNVEFPGKCDRKVSLRLVCVLIICRTNGGNRQVVFWSSRFRRRN